MSTKAGRAMDWLRKAVVAGYTDFTRFRYDADLAVLRDRKDFQELLGQVETNALAAARDAVRLQPQNAESHHLLAAVLRQQKKWNEAETAFRDVLRLDPGFPGCRFKLADVLITQGKGAEAEAECREILRVAQRRRRTVSIGQRTLATAEVA